jgi:hypothetical protein
MRSPAPRPPIAASLIIPSIFWGQNYVLVRPYALIFSGFLFYRFWIFSFSYFLPFLLSFSTSSYPSLLISSYSSHRCYSSSSYSSPLIFQTVCCITDMHINEIFTVFVHISVILRGFSKRPILFLFSYSSLLYYILPFLSVFFSSYNLIVCCRENPAKIPVWRKIRQSITLLI